MDLRCVDVVPVDEALFCPIRPGDDPLGPFETTAIGLPFQAFDHWSRRRVPIVLAQFVVLLRGRVDRDHGRNLAEDVLDQYAWNLCVDEERVETKTLAASLPQRPPGSEPGAHGPVAEARDA